MDSKYFGKLSIIGMKGSEHFLSVVDDYLHQWRDDTDGTYIVKADCPRFGTGEGKVSSLKLFAATIPIFSLTFLITA